MTINDRIKKLRKELNLTQVEFASYISLTQNHLTGIENGKRNVNNRTVKLICSTEWPNKKRVSEKWLEYGEGEMFVELDTDQEFAEAINQINFHGDELIKKIIIDYMHLNDENKKKAKQYILDLAAAVKKDKSI